MAQYREGLVSVTQGSPVVTGIGTAWTAAVIPGQVFSLYRSGVSYTVASVDGDTRLILSDSYAGASESGKPYTITRDFTPYFNLPYPDYGDIDTASMWKEMVLKVEDAIVAQDTGLNVIESRATATPPATPSERVNYIVPANATGPWAGQAGRIAVWDRDTWKFIQPQEGWRVYVRDESYIDVIYDEGGWQLGPQVGVAVAAAAESRDRARDWAEKTGGPVEGTRYSAKHHALAAGTSAQAAADTLTKIDTQAGEAQAAAQAAGAARTASETARDQTLANRSLAEAAADAAAQSRAAAEVAHDAVIAAKTTAQTAQASASLSKQEAEAARDRARAWAGQEDGPVDGGVHSARFYATQASGAATTAEALKTATEALKAAAETAAGTASVKAGELVTLAGQAAASAAAAGTRATDAANAATSATQSAIDALSAKTDAVNARDLTAIARTDAIAARDLAQGFAQAGHNTQVTPGVYSAYHWSEEARGHAKTAALIVGGSNFGIIGDGTAQRFTAQSPGAILNFVQGTGMALTFNPGTWSVTFTTDPATIDHDALKNAGTHGHAAIDAHLLDDGRHVPDSAPADTGKVLLASAGGVPEWGAVAWSSLTHKPATLAELGLSDVYTKTQTDTAIATGVTTAAAKMAGGAPPVLDTLGKLAIAIGNDPAFATTLGNRIEQKADRASLSAAALSGDYRDLTHQPVLPFVLANGTSSPIALTPGAL